MPKFGKGNPGRPKGAVNKATREIKEFAREVLEDPEYVESLKARIKAGEASHMEVLLAHYAYGKPADTLKHKGLTARLEVAVLRTADDIKAIKGQLDSDAGSDDDE